MCVVIDDKVIISNAFYANLKKFNQYLLDYDEVEKFKRILYKEIVKKYRYVMFSEDESNYIDVYEHLFIKENAGIVCFNEIDDSFINKVNSIYTEDIQKIIELSRDEMTNELLE